MYSIISRSYYLPCGFRNNGATSEQTHATFQVSEERRCRRRRRRRRSFPLPVAVSSPDPIWSHLVTLSRVTWSRATSDERVPAGEGAPAAADAAANPGDPRRPCCRISTQVSPRVP